MGNRRCIRLGKGPAAPPFSSFQLAVIPALLRTIWVCVLSVSFLSLSAQPADTLVSSNWRKKLNFTINFNQTSFSSNWKAGGINSIGLNSLFNYQISYANQGRSWDNQIDLAYGFVNNTGQGYRKTVDRIFLDTKYGRRLSSEWGQFLSLNLTSQFAQGYRYENGTGALISGFFAPAFITTAWGFEYHPQPYFNVRISPFAPRLTVVRLPRRFTETVGPEPYGVDSTKTVRFEWLSYQLLAEFNKELITNLNLKWRYVMFTEYESLRLRTIDHRFDIDILAKVNKFINVGLGAILLYDYDQDAGLQWSQVFSFGFLFTFQNFDD